MRDIYNTKVIGSIEQGTIINNCISDNYKNYHTHGIIITPRCDIGNNKVSTVHYLPVVCIDDWVKEDFWNIFSQMVKKELINKLETILKNNGFSKEIITSFSPDTIFNVLSQKITRKNDSVNFKKYIDQLNFLSLPTEKITNKDRASLVQEYDKISKNIFKDIKENKRKEFYLLEGWNQESQYYIVLLREIRKLNFDMAVRISNGVYLDEIEKHEREKNDLSDITSSSDGFIYSIATLKSPHIEHLIQQFFLNFGRIGVENHRLNLETEFYNNTINNLTTI